MAKTPGIPYGALINLAQRGRTSRSPEHHFNIRQRPYQAQPNLIAPVLPGETLMNALCQYTALTDPIKNPFLGWWMESFVYFVPFRAMAASDDLQTMLLDPAFGELAAGHDDAAAVRWYHANAADPSFAQQAMQAVMEYDFRDEGETWIGSGADLDGIPLMGMKQRGIFESAILNSAVSAEPDTIPGSGDQDGNLDENMYAGAEAQFANAYNAYQSLVAARVLDLTFEDWLRTYGVRIPKESEQPAPELIRHYRDWKKPGRAVDPTDGSIASAVLWQDGFRADKNRKFNEPGVIVGFSVFTPKVYFSKQVQAAIDSLKTGLDWLPAVLQNEAFTSLRMYANTAGPLAGLAGLTDYWLDVRDLFVNGDQFVNFALTETDAGLVAMPTSTLGRRFPTSADVDALFAAASPSNQIRMEGVYNLTFKTNVRDYTP